MTLTLSMPGSAHEADLKPRITVFGVGGAGGNAVNNMIQQDLEGVEFVVANTDAQALVQSQAQHRVQLGVRVTEGLGAGAKPAVGASAAEETIEEIVDRLAGAHMCFITAGMGGGTGTGAAPIIAQAARELGILTVGVVTKPFQFEGTKRMRQAEEGLEALQKVVDTLIIIPNQNLFRLASAQTTFTEAFQMADDVLYQGVKGVTDLMVRPGMINLDFADVRSVMDEMGKAMMGTGEANGDDRAKIAAESAIANPLLDEISLKGAKGVLINITGGYDMTLFEMDEAANSIREQVDPDANIIVGSTLDPTMEGTVRVSVVATGIDAQASEEAPAPRRRLSDPFEAAAPAPAPAPAVEEAPRFERPAAAVAPEPAPEPVAYAPAPAPAPAPAVAAEAESFFDARAAQEAEAPEAAPMATAHEAPGDDFFSRRPAAPEPEAIDRLKRAVLNGERRAEAAPAAAPTAPEAGGRFGLGGLLGRMSGTPEGAAMRAPAPQPTPVAHPAAEAAPEEERIEIPAFLRRQAN
ncbi:cell division protein FtsZ [Jannaschia sp. Os4]|uniref:cell division protein FtsZ n=1 Tax=Jannaschia sp. Os4 TaxID=2807617 RepID=UPI00193A6F78|nr:cell division protein FtsZ [Jannaschia sp. Os4]MBM2577470.1 cell division protein FtsZ [Jannaschia sp. Os4]